MKDGGGLRGDLRLPACVSVEAEGLVQGHSGEGRGNAEPPQPDPDDTGLPVLCPPPPADG